MIKLVILSVLFITLLVVFFGSLWIAIEIAYAPPEIHDGCPCLDLAWPRECYKKVGNKMIRECIVKSVKEDYIENSDVVMSEYLRSCDLDLTIEEKRYLLEWAGEDDVVISKED